MTKTAAAGTTVVDQYLTVTEVMDYLGIARPTVYSHIRRGTLTPHYAPAHPTMAMFLRSELDRILVPEPRPYAPRTRRKRVPAGPGQ